MIVQGCVIPENLRREGKDRAWLDGLLREHGLKCPGEVFLLTLDDRGRTALFPADRPLRRMRQEAV